MRLKVSGTGSYVPEKIVSNHDLERLVDTSDEWIRERTGIRQRHVIGEETTTFMAAKAARRALEDAKMQASQVELIIMSTFTSDVLVPCGACAVQKLIGADHAACFDLNAACTGFLTAYQTVQAYMEAGFCRTALIIGSESLSEVTDWSDRGTCILFGDGAGAAVICADEGRGYLPVLHSMGEKGDALTCSSAFGGRDGKIRMDGQEVFRFAVRNVPEGIREVLGKNGLDMDDVDGFLLHQANRRIVEAVAKRLGADIGRFPMNIQAYGNTSSASIPILLDECRRKGLLKKGGTYVMAGFGGGLTWGASVLTL